MFVVKTRRIGSATEYVRSTFFARSDADAFALALNCKPFTPFFSWVEEV